MSGNVIENPAIKAVSISSRECLSVLASNCALCAAGRADLGHSLKIEAALHARLHDDVNRIVALLRRCPRFEFVEKTLDAITNILLNATKRCCKRHMCSRIAAEAAVIDGSAIG